MPQRPRATIGLYLVALVMVAVVPLMLIAGVLVWRQAVVQREVFDRSLVQTAQALSLAVDRELFASRVMLETLAQSPLLDSGNMEGFYRLCARVIAERQGLFISLFDPSGRQIFNTLRPFGQTLPSPFEHPPAPHPEEPPVGDVTALRQVLQTGEPANSDLFQGLVAKRVLFTVNVPVVRDGAIRYVVNAAFEPGVMTRLLHESPQFRGVSAVILDRRGFIVGRSKDAEKFVGRRAASHLVEHMKKQESGVGTGNTLQGIPLYYSFSRSASSGWTASVGANRTELEGAVRTGWIVGGALMVGGLALGLLFALSIAARLRHAIVALANAASRSEPVTVGGLRTREIELLERAVVEAAQAREARVRREEAEAANKMKDHYIATLSHELRNPLAALANAVHLLALEAKNDPTAASTVEMMQRQIAQLTRMVNDLLDVSRITFGKVSLQLGTVDLKPLLEEALEALPRALDDEKGLRLSRSLPAEPIVVQADAARLRQVFSNLLDNATKFSSRGGEIGVTLERHGNEAIVTVTDRGVGVDPSFLPRMFEPFTQADNRLERSTGGLGLGLALAREIVEAHGGRIEAASEGTGRGTRLIVRLPLARA